jgi:fructose-1,6-bisphosphatase/inositol monophosphatase family enzyme
MRSVEVTESMDVKMKGVDDPLTVADIKAQTLIIKGLR